jgi:hypothetical protein
VQLRSETIERASKLDIPIVLDILSLEDNSLRFNWRSRPWGAPSEWGRLHLMEVQLHLQPFSLKLACPDDLELARQHATKKHRRRYLKLLREETIERVATSAAEAIGMCVLSILQGDGHEPAGFYSPLRCQHGIWRDRPGVTKLPNSIAHLFIDFSPALDEVGKPIGIPQGAVLEEWYVPEFDFKQFLCFSDSYDEETLLLKDHLWPRQEGARYIDMYPVVTYVGFISVCWDRKPMSKNLEGKAVFDVGGAIFEQGEEDSVDMRKVRKQLGW